MAYWMMTCWMMAYWMMTCWMMTYWMMTGPCSLWQDQVFPRAPRGTRRGTPGCQPVMMTITLMTSTYNVARFPDPLAFGSGSGLQCVYTVVILLWGTPAPTFLLEPPKTLFYWIAPCIRKPQAEFQKFSSTHVSPSDWFISSSWSPLLVMKSICQFDHCISLFMSPSISLWMTCHGHAGLWAFQ